MGGLLVPRGGGLRARGASGQRAHLPWPGSERQAPVLLHGGDGVPGYGAEPERDAGHLSCRRLQPPAPLLPCMARGRVKVEVDLRDLKRLLSKPEEVLRVLDGAVQGEARRTLDVATF